ncbi:hypothetical protein L3Y34_018528 [Caenorhabditis briggsae]|uniref:Uncharacterized protein n=1 Tax=Caenorhabditis briggsae TaxID=6238 RepID=A0AAE9DLQ3_CAEBR|nr:hypothetical protein L3Y34_018528 [Caenorhabditis briggsae]
MVKNLTESKGYKTAINGVERVKNLEKAVVINTVTPTPPKQGYSTYKVDRTTFGNAITRVVQVREAFSVVLDTLKPIFNNQQCQRKN